MGSDSVHGGWMQRDARESSYAVVAAKRRTTESAVADANGCSPAVSMGNMLDHARLPYHRGRLADAMHVHAIRHPTCGDQVCLQLRIVEPGLVAEAWFDGRGCLVSQAAASILCETIEGRRLPDLRDFTAEAFLATIGTPLTPARRGCALLAWQALHAILASITAESATAEAAA